MKELNRTRRLIIATILFVVIIMVGFLTFKSPDFEYAISPVVLIEELNKPNKTMTPDEAMKIIDNGYSSTVFVDLRNPFEFNKGFLGEAINIPVSDILLDESIEFFQQMENDSIVVILYSNNQREANGPWMLLKQIGFNNMKVLLGGYDYLVKNEFSEDNIPEMQEYSVEEPILDYAAFFESIDNNGDNSRERNTDKPIIIQPVKRKKKSVTAGGC